MIALAFLADVADVRRFRTLRKMNAYLGLVPRASNSGGKSRPGHITRESRKLTRTILTQCVHHVAPPAESPQAPREADATADASTHPWVGRSPRTWGGARPGLSLLPAPGEPDCETYMSSRSEVLVIWRW